jgi:polyribonucleotide nucleotidyltransferase
VHYQEKYYAAGKVPGGFFKREARPTEKETLTARLIDRPIRPLFVPGFKNEVLVMCTVLSHDLVNDPDIVAMIAASAALTISGAPFMGPIAGCRVGFEDGEYILNPTVDDMHDLRNNPEQRLDLVVAGTKDAVMMVESEAYELTEAEMLGAVKFAHEQIQPVIDLIIALAEDAAKEPFDFQAPDYSELYAAVRRPASRRCAKPMPSPTSWSVRTPWPPRRRRSRRAHRRAAGRPEPRLRAEKARVHGPALRRGQERPPDRRARARCGSRDRLPDLGSAPDPRLGAVHPW